MKYIKAFEKKNLNYKELDYVYVVGYPDINNLCQISIINKYKYNGGWDYMVNYFDEDGYHEHPCGIHIDESDIERYLTMDETEEFESKKLTLKFNL